METLIYSIIKALRGAGIPAFTAQMTNAEQPYAYISVFDEGELPNKTDVVYSGFITITLVFKGRDTREHLSLIRKAKTVLKPSKWGTIAPTVNRWTLTSNTGLYAIDEVSYDFRASLVYSFEYSEGKTYNDRVVSDDGNIENLNCVINGV